jgi:hypothetical protein
VNELLGEALLELLRQGLPRRVPPAAELLDSLRKAATPPPGVELFSADGAAFTGVVIVDCNRPIVMLAGRQGSAPRTQTSPSIPPSSARYGHPPYGQRSLFDDR